MKKALFVLVAVSLSLNAHAWVEKETNIYAKIKKAAVASYKKEAEAKKAPWAQARAATNDKLEESYGDKENSTTLSVIELARNEDAFYVDPNSGSRDTENDITLRFLVFEESSRAVHEGQYGIPLASAIVTCTTSETGSDDNSTKDELGSISCKVQGSNLVTEAGNLQP